MKLQVSLYKCRQNGFSYAFFIFFSVCRAAHRNSDGESFDLAGGCSENIFSRHKADKPTAAGRDQKVQSQFFQRILKIA
ncbi:MAG: hypothetical protein ONB44_06600 [candidate division KSB1 bacterium]|nr:hypothetical protein [candidate division KSB1 bacterium]MDZ7301793.1 hypothetical protein [candidate division KSB1 bacterium]MDZ7311428.1 hypothetical protein [candidate division KSB1 bacterium]